MVTASLSILSPPKPPTPEPSDQSTALLDNESNRTPESGTQKNQLFPNIYDDNNMYQCSFGCCIWFSLLHCQRLNLSTCGTRVKVCTAIAEAGTSCGYLGFLRRFSIWVSVQNEDSEHRQADKQWHGGRNGYDSCIPYSYFSKPLFNRYWALPGLAWYYQ